MDFICLLICLGILMSTIIIWTFIYADADFTLLFVSRFGKSTASLAGKVVWITGASSGIGEHLAYELAKVGCQLILSARRVDELESVKQKCLKIGKLNDTDVLVLPLDVQEFGKHKAITDDVFLHFNQLDILINNAGRSAKGWAMKTSLEVDKQIFEINVLGTISMTRNVLPHFIKRKQGQIIVTSSIAGKIGTPLQAAYSLSKHALHGWFDALRIELADSNVQITLACPGPVFSDIRKAAFTEEADQLVNEAMATSEKRMSTQRCAELMVVAIANKLDETWISQQPILLFAYLFQYAPTLGRKIGMMLGVPMIQKLRYRKDKST